jgi:hypothetical protein
VSRRALLAAAPVIAATALLVVPAAAQSFRTDDAFWSAHTKWAQLRADWNADKDPDDDAVFERWNDAETDAFKAMLLIPVGTASAILAKQKAAHFDNAWPEPFALQAIEVDLTALAARETV